MELNLDALRAARARTEVVTHVTIYGHPYAVNPPSVATALAFAEAQDAAKHDDIGLAARLMREAVGSLLADPADVPAFLRSVTYDDLSDLLESLVPEAPGASSPPSANDGPSAKPTAPASTAWTSPTPVSVLTP